MTSYLMQKNEIPVGLVRDNNIATRMKLRAAFRRVI